MAKRKGGGRRGKRSGAASGPKPPVRRRCGAMVAHEALLEKVPGLRARLARLEHATMANMMAGAKKKWVVPTIPVVVHVVWKDPAENISAAQVKSQIAVLNKDFRKLNPDHARTPAPFQGLVADAGVKFTLKKIVRKETNVASWGTDDKIKKAASGGSDPVRPVNTLNLWVGTLGGGLLGYAQFPGGPPATDGVVILNTAFGTVGTAAAPFDKGRTATHEIGHWLNLRHIWGDTPDCTGGDGVADTPNCEGPNTGEPTFPRVTCMNGPHGDMFMNYMDYVDDKAMFMFTAGQVVRMRTALETTRKAFL